MIVHVLKISMQGNELIKKFIGTQAKLNRSEKLKKTYLMEFMISPTNGLALGFKLQLLLLPR